MRITKEQLGNRLTAARILAELSQPRVISDAKNSEVPGLGQTSISEIENGKKAPNTDALQWLCARYDIELEVLLDPDYQPFKADSRLGTKVDRLAELVDELVNKDES